MHITLTADERERLTATARERRVRHWRRYQALLLIAADTPPAAVAATVGCSRVSVYSWVNAWRGVAGLTESSRATPPRPHVLPLTALLATLLDSDPQRYGHHATGWTVALLHGEVRRSVRRLGWRWKRPKYVLGRPDPAYEEKRGR